ncbi:MAG: hypothetical protein DRR06_00220 [Gammaproteobacteria bacterium]|nr:MAG: hypothetical protein DRR06_00220 [Gammaproteobacteria bacterium]
MDSNQNIQGLEWLGSEVDASLVEACEALNGYASNDSEDNQLRFCLAYIHQVTGSLKIAECHGGALLSEEVEAVINALLLGKVSASHETIDVLNRAMIAMPSYLRECIASRFDQPAVLLTLLNDLRATRNKPLASNCQFFNPNIIALTTLPTSSGIALAEEQPLQGLISKLRQLYQYSLLAFVKGEDEANNLKKLTKVFHRLAEVCHGHQLEQLWLVAAAIPEGIEADALARGAAINSLLWELEAFIRKLSNDGITSFDDNFPYGLFKNLLYYITVAEPVSSSRLAAIQQKFKLDEALPTGVLAHIDNGLTPSYDLEVVQSLASSLREELDSVKANITSIADGKCEPEPVAAIITPAITRIADTLAMVGQSSLRRLVNELAEQLYAILCTGDKPEKNQLFIITSRLTDIGTALHTWAADYQQGVVIKDDVAESAYLMTEAQQSLVREVRNNLEAVKEAVVRYISSQWDTNFLQDVPTLTEDIQGAIAVVGLPGPARIMGALGDYIGNELIKAPTPPGWDKLDALADAITGVDCFLEAISGNSRVDQQNLLDIAEAALSKLGTMEGGAAASADMEKHQRTPDDLQVAEAPKLNVATEERAALESPRQQPAAALKSISAMPDKPEVGDEEDDDFDEEIAEIFVEEAREILQSLGETYPLWLANRKDSNALADTRRSFHSLKGSGRMVNASHIGELGFAIENLFNKVIESKLVFDDKCEQLLNTVLEILPVMVSDFESKRQNDKGGLVGALMATAEALVSGDPVSEVPQVCPEENEEDELDTVLVNIFTEEALDHVSIFACFIDNLKNPSTEGLLGDTGIARSIHMLIGSAHVAGIKPVAELSEALDALIKPILDSALQVDNELIALLEESVACLRELIEAPGNIDAAKQAASDTLQQRLAKIGVSNLIVTPEVRNRLLLNNLLVRGLQRLLDAPNILQNCHARANDEQNQAIVELAGELSELAQAATAAQCQGITTLAKHFGNALNVGGDAGCKFDEQALVILNQAHESLLDMIDRFVAEQPVKEVSAQLISELSMLAETSIQHEQNSDAAEPEAEEVMPGPSASADVNGRSAKEPQQDIAAVADSDDTDHELEEVDAEIVAIFVEEAAELLEQIEQAIQAWRENVDDNSCHEKLIRELHTLKGGARTAGFMRLGDLSHNLETFIEDNWAPGGKVEGFFDELLKRYDELVELFDQLKLKSANENDISPLHAPDPAPSEATIERDSPDKPGEPEPDDAAHQTGRRVAAAAQVIPFGTRPGLGELAAPGASPAPTEVHEMIKVSATAIDNLVNLVGETSITRGRIEQKINEFTFSLDEMESTIVRLHNQVRRIGVETEAQILFRREQLRSADDNETFDPLELDRYSQLQHLFRALQESASDLQEVKDTLLNNATFTERLLLQQSQVSIDLQDNLMLTRMVPFTRLVPRLRRVVRQVSNELNKPVELQLHNIDGEMDRTVLGKIISPLEHMIRNAIDHGIESPAVRSEQGKPAEGNIALTFGREGGEIIIRLTDDGKGMDIDAIRKQAVSGGLITEATQINEEELLQLIFLPGFSTSDTISHVSGRGVGLNVVANEVRQLGGSVAISSKPGLGTEFEIRVPFKVSINSALMIRSNSEQYALPLSTILGVVKVPPSELAGCYDTPAEKLHYGGIDYQVCLLSSLLNEHRVQPVLPVDEKIALVLVAATESRHYAVQVDSLAGSREIVIKGLGPLFGDLVGLSGVTVTGDGKVVCIVDLPALLRIQGEVHLLASSSQLNSSKKDIAGQLTDSITSGESTKNGIKTIMIVDDSVTVRKVASRFLEREGFKVVTAKDGIDAVDMLNEVEPDLMLLDIEMPRMDGFDVAKIVRNESDMKTLPIIMISSRSGEKHRNKALAYGVDHFLGKPYQEDELLTLITNIFDG